LESQIILGNVGTLYVQHASGITINHKIGKPNNLKAFGSKKTKGHQKYSQHWLRSPMTEIEEP
jgi:hypothetical protein